MPKKKTLALSAEVNAKKRGVKTKLQHIKADVVRKKAFLNTKKTNDPDVPNKRVLETLDKIFPILNDKKRKEVEKFLMEMCAEVNSVEKTIDDAIKELSELDDKVNALENGALFELMEAYKLVPNLSSISSHGTTRIYSREPISLGTDSPFL